MEHWGVYENSLKHVRVEVLVFKERGKPEYPEKNLSEQGREPKTNSTHIWGRCQDLNPDHIGGTEASAVTTATPLPPRQLSNKARWEQVRGDKVDLSKGAH